MYIPNLRKRIHATLFSKIDLYFLISSHLKFITEKNKYLNTHI